MGIFDPSGGQYLSPSQAMGAAMMAASGPSRLPVPIGSVIGQGLIGGQDAYQKGLLRALQAKGLDTQNQLSGLTLEGYKRMQGLLGGGAPTAQGAISSNMGGPTPGGTPGFAPDVSNPNPVQNPVAYAQVPFSGSARAQAVNAITGGSANPQQVSNQPPPLFNMGSIYQQYRAAASTPGMQQVASQLLSLIEKGTPEGAYVGTDGGIYSRPGYDQFLQGQSSAKEAGAAPYKAVESLLSQAGRSIRLGPGDVATTGLNAMPPAFQNAIMGLLGGRQPASFAPPSTSPTSPTIQPASVPARPVLPSATTGTPGTSAIGFPIQPTSAPGGGIQSPISLQGKTLAENILPKQYEDAATQYKNAQGIQGNLDMIDHAIEELNRNGLSSTGAGANVKFGAMKALNSLATSAGMEAPFDPSKIATWEDFNKESTRMGFELAKSLGSREAMMIVQQAIAAVPNASNTYLGARLVSSSLRQAAQRQSDYYEFLNSYAGSHGGSTFGADVAFNKTHPMKSYTDQAVVNSVPPDVLSRAPDAARAYLAKHPNTVSDFVQHYGGM
jgi:hypothetical protein